MRTCIGCGNDEIELHYGYCSWCNELRTLTRTVHEDRLQKVKPYSYKLFAACMVCFSLAILLNVIGWMTGSPWSPVVTAIVWLLDIVGWTCLGINWVAMRASGCSSSRDRTHRSTSRRVLIC
jgi:hypothetical protein